MADSRVHGLSTVALADDRSILHDKSGDAAAGAATVGALRTHLATSWVGKQTIWVPAGAIRPSATGGCAPLAQVATAANRPDLFTLDFHATTQEYCQFFVAMPKSWDLGTVSAKFAVSHAATTTNFGMRWGLQGVAISNDDPISAAYGTAQEVTITGGTTDDWYWSSETSAITLAGSPAQGDVVAFRAYRDPTNGADNMAIDGRLHGILLFFTTNAGNDA